MDFFQTAVKEKKKGEGFEVYPDFVVGRSDDLMVRAKNFYAVWDEAANLWSTDEYVVQRIVDDVLHSYQKDNRDVTSVKSMRSFGTNVQSNWRKYLASIGDHYTQLDEKLTFLTTKVEKKDYVSKRLPYDLAPGDISAWDRIVGTLYSDEEREKIEWFIGSIVSGDSKINQKFLVLEGPPGAGKGTIINIIMMLFPGYITTFDAKALGSNGNQFAAAAFAGNPMVAIQHDGDLSKVEDNTTINSIVSHEIMKINEKYKPSYDARINAALIMGTNKPVKITDSQSGIIRRLIDVHPTGVLIPPKEYHRMMDQIKFELGSIAHHCLTLYKKLSKNYYSNYRPVEMMYKTNAFFNYIELHRDLFEAQGGVTAKQAWNLYKEYCEEANIDRPMKQMEFKAELSTYFERFHDRFNLSDGQQVRSYYEGLKTHVFKMPVNDDTVTAFTLALAETTSLLDLELTDCPAQYAKANGAPSKYWDDSERIIDGKAQRPPLSQVVSTTLQEIDTTREHYVRPPANLIIPDFDIRDENGEKSLELNLAAAAEWPATYAEVSKSGAGVHLHYWYDGDTSQLDPNYAPGIEIKVFTGNSALRRRLSQCNNIAIATISSGLPFKENKRVLEAGTIKSAKALRELINRNLRKEIHPGTKPSIDFINHILVEANKDGLTFDVEDMYPQLIGFANRSTNRQLECIKIVQNMKLKSDDMEELPPPPAPKEERLVLFDIEVYPNLLVICWKFKEKPGEKPSPKNVTRMINPKPHEVEALMNFKLVAFNNLKYDNHILWAAAMGYSNFQLYQLSKRIIDNVVGAKFGEAYRISWTDVYDFSTKKQGLKQWQIELGLNHKEMDIPWGEPVPDDRIMDVVDYCVNDVVSLEEVFDHLQGDWTARQILADLAGLTPNESTAKLTTAIVYGKEKNPQRHFQYTDLRKDFPGYVFDPTAKGVKSTYRGIDVGEGGYVFGKPGLYRNVGLFDVASMHPTSIGQLNLFGEYTPKYMALVDAQLAIKNGRYAEVKDMLDGKLVSYIEDIERIAETDKAAAKKVAAELRYGLKIAMNIVYGLTSAKFDNAFNHRLNLDNIVAKRGALFMIDLQLALQEAGKNVVHIKTDSVKVADYDDETVEIIMSMGKKHGYTFEHEATYEKFGLVNDAVYVAKKDHCVAGEWIVVDDNGDEVKYWKNFEDENGKPIVCWTATGTQYQVPYVFKKMFGLDDWIDFNDLGETKSVVKGAMYLDFGIADTNMNGGEIEPMGHIDLALADIKVMKKNGLSEEEQLKVYNEALSKLIFVGKTGRFTPVKEGFGGGQLYRISEDKKHYAVAGTKGYLWVDSNLAMDLPDDAIDYNYFDDLYHEGLMNLEQYLEGSTFETVEEFLV